MKPRRLCVNCEQRPPRWRPAYSPLRKMFCSQRCAAAYAHDLVAEDEDHDPAAEAAESAASCACIPQGELGSLPLSAAGVCSRCGGAR